jgi:hypothetical protein
MEGATETGSDAMQAILPEAYTLGAIYVMMEAPARRSIIAAVVACLPDIPSSLHAFLLIRSPFLCFQEISPCDCDFCS